MPRTGSKSGTTRSASGTEKSSLNAVPGAEPVVAKSKKKKSVRKKQWTQFDWPSQKETTLDALKNSVKENSEVAHRYWIETGKKTVKVYYSNPDQYGNPGPAAYIVYPIVPGGSTENPNVLLNPTRIVGPEHISGDTFLGIEQGIKETKPVRVAAFPNTEEMVKRAGAEIVKVTSNRIRVKKGSKSVTFPVIYSPDLKADMVVLKPYRGSPVLGKEIAGAPAVSRSAKEEWKPNTEWEEIRTRELREKGEFVGLPRTRTPP